MWSEWARLRGKGLASILAPACQDTSHVGNVGVGVVTTRGAPIALPTFATASLGGSLSVAGPLGVPCLLMVGGSCTQWFCMVIRVLILTLSSLL